MTKDTKPTMADLAAAWDAGELANLAANSGDPEPTMVLGVDLRVGDVVLPTRWCQSGTISDSWGGGATCWPVGPGQTADLFTGGVIVEILRLGRKWHNVSVDRLNGSVKKQAYLRNTLYPIRREEDEAAEASQDEDETKPEGSDA